MNHTEEYRRLHEPYTGLVRPWRKWGPYVSERSWGTVREDYSPHGTAWDYLTHDLARSKAYRWGEDGIAAICDRYQILTFALAFWNGRDPILKERLFGLASGEGNHGEDVKEYYFYLDSTPTHSYMRMLYKYPPGRVSLRVVSGGKSPPRRPRVRIRVTGYRCLRSRSLLRHFVEYAKESPEDIAIRIEVFNRGPEDAELHVLPHLWFRNTWAWTDPAGPEPIITLERNGCLRADDTTAAPPKNLHVEYRLGARHLYGPLVGTPLFTDNETDASRVFGPGAVSSKRYVKDAFHRYLVNGETDQVNPEHTGTKACFDYKLQVRSGQSSVLRLRMTPEHLEEPLADVDAIVAKRKADADEFYATIQPPRATQEERMIQRQALAGLLWSKQLYLFDVNQWLEGDNPALPPPESRKHLRNTRWRHLNSMRILSMPDKWEYPWFAAWDLAFHCISMALVDPGFAKDNLWFLLFEQFQHINGQIPAYEWEFSDLNPPVHAWGCWRVYEIEHERTGVRDREFSKSVFTNC